MLREVEMNEVIYRVGDGFFRPSYALKLWLTGKLPYAITIKFMDEYNLSRSTENLIELALELLPRATGAYVDPTQGIISVHCQVRTQRQREVLFSETRRLVVKGLFGQIVEPNPSSPLPH